jgi:hypothetical protein
MSSRTPALPAAVMKQLITQTGGNPLALIELPSMLTPAELAGQHALPEPLPAGRQIELAYAALAGRLEHKACYWWRRQRRPAAFPSCYELLAC